MNLDEFIIKVVEKTDGWVLVGIVLIYVGYQVYSKHAEGAALKQSLDILNRAVRTLLENIDRNITTLAASVRSFIDRFPTT
jgi:hypothetical protein